MPVASDNFVGLLPNAANMSDTGSMHVKISDHRIKASTDFYPTLDEADISHMRHYPLMSEDELAERIRVEAKRQGISQTELARVAGMPSQSAMSNVFKGKRRLTIQEADRLKNLLNIEDTPSVQWVPRIGLASAGNWNEAVLMSAGEVAIPLRKAGKRAFAVEIRGDSMDMLLPEGGWAVIDPDQTNLYTGRVYLVQNADSEVTVKRYASDPARLEPVSRNDMHQPIMLTGYAYTVIGRVVAYGNDEGL